MARPSRDLPHDPVLVSINEGQPIMSFDEWLAELAHEEPADRDADAAELLREMRERGER